MKFKVPTLLLFAFLALSACATSPAQSPTPTPTPTFAVKPTPTAIPHSKVGDTVTVDGLEVTLVSAKIVDPATIPQHEQIFVGLKADETFLVLAEHVKNIGTTDHQLAGMQFFLQDEAGHSNFAVQLGVPGVDGGIGGPVAAGMQQAGGNAYIVPKSAHRFYWIFAPSNGAQVIWDVKCSTYKCGGAQERVS